MKAIHFPSLHQWSPLSPFARSLITSFVRRSRQRKAFRHLSELDDHLLRDIGLERSLVALAAEVGPERVCVKPNDQDHI